MIQSGQASLSVRSSETEPDVVSRLLNLEPTDITYKGTVRRSGRTVEHHVWHLDTDELANTSDDRAGTRALRALLELTRPAIGRVAKLPPDCEARIWWSASSDSVQGGFVLAADLAAEIASLGVDVVGTVYLEDRNPPH
ncbi:DUF4279 domain-containing protein [Agromyces sp. MMS24-JH15]|uniref:DUF4279 domain-containing protein n=1 Tax=Agromyces sp. MMS24-JH15 TaxID=3243765 RepID=UPI0037480625